MLDLPISLEAGIHRPSVNASPENKTAWENGVIDHWHAALLAAGNTCRWGWGVEPWVNERCKLQGQSTNPILMLLIGPTEAVVAKASMMQQSPKPR